MLRQRFQLRFSKKGDLRFVSHLDLMRTFERALRRAKLPLRMTDGFNPHPRLSFPLSLGVGVEGSDEVMEFELSAWVPAPQVQKRLEPNLPPGLELKSLKLRSPGRAARVVEITYGVCPYAPEDLPVAIDAGVLQELLNREKIVVTRRRKGRLKEVDIRPFVIGLRLEGKAVIMHFRVGPQGTARAEEILEALGIPPDRCQVLFHIERTQVLLSSPHKRRPVTPGRSEEF